MSLTRRLVLGGGSAPLLLGAANGVASPPAVIGGGRFEIRTFESFGAKGDAPDASGRGTDDTGAIQAAIDWAYGDDRRLPRALSMGDRGYLCGKITLHPTTTIIGSGRQTSMFVCKRGTRGAWFGTRGGGAQKIMLSGIAFYARGEGGVGQILELGTGADEHPLGTESILEGLWMRDAPEGIALEVSGNVAIIKDITCQNTRIGLSARGNASHAENIIIMQAGEGAQTSRPVIGADINGWFVRGLHIEATVERGVPLRMRGNSQILHVFIATVTGYQHDHLIEIDDSEYREWSLHGIRLSENRYGVRNGIIKHRLGYFGGKNTNGFTGRSLIVEGKDTAANTALAGATVTLVLTLASDDGGLRHRTSAPGSPEAEVVSPGPLIALSPVAVRTPLEGAGFAGGGRLAGAELNRFLFALARPATGESAGIATVERNSSGVPMNVAVDFTGGGLALVFTHASTGKPVNLSDMPRGAVVVVNVRAEF